MMFVRIGLAITMIVAFVVLSTTISSGLESGFSDMDMIIIRVSGVIAGFALMANFAFGILGVITKNKNIKK